MVGLELPVLAMEHMYLLTEDMPEVAEFNAATGTEIVARASTSRARSTCARSAAACCSAPTRRPACRGRRSRHAVGFRPRTAAARPRPHRAVAGSRLQAFPGAREGRHQADHQRPLHLRARRQPAGRPGAGPAEFLVRLRRHGRLQPGRRRRPGAVATGWSTAIPASTSGRWTSPASANGRRCGYTNAKVRENYSRRFSHPLPQRGAAGGAAAADDGALRHDDRAGRGHGRQLGAGDAALVRAEGRRAEGHRLLPPLQRLSRM